MRAGWEGAVKAAIGGAVLLALAFGGQVRGSGIETATAVVPDGSSAVLTVANFVRIKKFVLAQGKRKTYCNRYNNNPYWAFPAFNAYLNPADPGNINSETGNFEFNELVIQANVPQPANQYWSSPGPITEYWHISLDATRKELRVQQDYSKTEPRALVQEVTEYCRAALAEIDRQTKHGESGQQEPAAGKWRHGSDPSHPRLPQNVNTMAPGRPESGSK
jgi:hypothetical protein